MPIDSLFLSAAAAELRARLLGSRIDKIQQPEKDVLFLSMRGAGGPCRVLVSAGSGTARVHVTAGGRENPAEPPMFCMLLRKHLIGGRLTAIEQPDMDRLYLMRFACLDELGIPSEKTLAVEMLGRAANLILIDGDGRIIDCLRRIDAEKSSKRQLLPGLFYATPPKPEKPDFFRLSAQELNNLMAAADGSKPGDLWLCSAAAGLSPLLARELVCRAAGTSDSPVSTLSGEALLEALTEIRGSFQPVLIKSGDKPSDLYCAELRQYGSALRQEVYPDYSALLDAFYTERERLERQNQRSQALVKLVRTRRDRAARKLTLRTEEQQATANRDTWRQWGDLIKANLYRMSRGQRELEAENFYAEAGGTVRIPLDPKLSPQQNAAHYYKQYAKAKNAEKVLAGQIQEAEEEIRYLESVLEELSLAAGERDLAEIRRELTEQGYLRESGGKRKKQPAPQPMRFLSSEGALILVGRNNLQNDWLTLHQADKHSVWLHAQKTHGAHVVAVCGEDDADTLREAAMLAAWYSKGRDGANVPVDYTQVRWVRKPAGARPGMVIYTNYRTLYVTPERAAVESLQRKG